MFIYLLGFLLGMGFLGAMINAFSETNAIGFWLSIIMTAVSLIGFAITTYKIEQRK